METISNTTCTKCQCCGEWTNYADDAHHKEREARIAELEAALEQALFGLCSVPDSPQFGDLEGLRNHVRKALGSEE